MRFLASNLRLGSSRDVQLIACLLLALASMFLAYTARTHEITHDAFHEMALYRQSLIDGAMPMQDAFAYTPTVDPSVHHEWGTGAVLYFVTMGTGLGLVGLSALKLLLMSALWLILYRVARMRGANPIVFAIIAFAVFPVMWVGFATVRAQLFTLVFLALQLWMQECDRLGKKFWVPIWVGMMVAWLNLHAGFVVGIAMMIAHSGEAALQSLLQHRSLAKTARLHWHLPIALLGAVCVLPINPYGWKYIPYLVHAIRMPRPLIREWKPIWHTYAPGITILLLIAAAVMLILPVVNELRKLRARSSSPGESVRRLRGWPFLALSLWMTIKHIRHGSLFGVVWLAYVPAWISRLELGNIIVEFARSHRAKVMQASLGVSAACGLFACYHHFYRPSLPPTPLYSTACYPVGAVDYLAESQFQGNLLTPFHVGSYVSWRMGTDVQVSFDGRYEVAYETRVMDDHNRLLSGEGQWWAMLDEFPTDAMLIHRDAPLYDLLAGESTETESLLPPELAGWYLAYQDPAFLILAAPSQQATLQYASPRPLRDGAWDVFSPQYSHWSMAKRHHEATEQRVASTGAARRFPAPQQRLVSRVEDAATDTKSAQ